MLNFEQWSEEVYKLVDLIEQSEAKNEEISQYQNQLKVLWDELFEHEEDDMYVQFLTELLSMTKGVLNGDQDPDQLSKMVDNMRENVLK